MEAAGGTAELEQLRRGVWPSNAAPQSFWGSFVASPALPWWGDALGTQDGGLRGGSGPTLGVQTSSSGTQKCSCLCSRSPICLHPTVQALSARHRESSLNST